MSIELNISPLQYRKEIAKDFEYTLNRWNADNEANTPDYLLAEYLTNCLENYIALKDANERWHGKTIRINS